MRFGSKKMTGSSDSIELINRPFASYGFDGITVMMPLTCAKIASGLCEWVWPPRIPPPQGVRIVTGEKNSPQDR